MNKCCWIIFVGMLGCSEKPSLFGSSENCEGLGGMDSVSSTSDVSTSSSSVSGSGGGNGGEGGMDSGIGGSGGGGGILNECNVDSDCDDGSICSRFLCQDDGGGRHHCDISELPQGTIFEVEGVYCMQKVCEWMGRAHWVTDLQLIENDHNDCTVDDCILNPANPSMSAIPRHVPKEDGTPCLDARRNPGTCLTDQLTGRAFCLSNL